MIIRPAGKSDYQDLAALWFKSWMSIGISNETDLPREGVAERFNAEAGRWHLFAAVDEDGAIAGFLALLPEEGRIDQLFVAPDRKGQGIGAALLAFATSKMPLGIELTTHETNVPARKFYERHGFRQSGSEDDPAHRRVKIHYVWQP